MTIESNRGAGSMRICTPGEDTNHHWKIDSPSGSETTMGVCERCGERKEFSIVGKHDGAWVKGKGRS